MKIFLHSLVFVGLLSAALTGCTSLSTGPASAELGTDPTHIAGLFYYLPEGRIHAVGTPSSDGNSFTITVTADIVPDTRAAYFIKRDANYTYDDVIDLKVDGNGLLANGNATSTDQTASIISSVIGMLPKGPLLAPPLTPQLKAFNVTFYPKDAKLDSTSAALSYDAAHKALLQCGVDLEGSSIADPEDLTNPNNLDSPMKKLHPYQRIVPSDFVDGVAFRLGKAYTVTFSSLPTYAPTLLSSASVILPDKKRTYYLDYSRMPFVAKITNVNFTNGMLTQFHQETPSPINGFLAIPKSIIQAIIPIPGAAAATPSGSSTGKGTSTSKS